MRKYQLIAIVSVLLATGQPLTVAAAEISGSAFAAEISGFAFEAQRSKQVVYLTDPDRHIHELSVLLDGGSWSHADLSAIARR